MKLIIMFAFTCFVMYWLLWIHTDTPQVVPSKVTEITPEADENWRKAISCQWKMTAQSLAIFCRKEYDFFWTGMYW